MSASGSPPQSPVRPKPRTFLIPLNLSPGSTRALEFYASEICQEQDNLILVGILPTSIFEASPLWDAAQQSNGTNGNLEANAEQNHKMRKQAEERILSQFNKACEAFSIPQSVVDRKKVALVHGPAASSICRASRYWQANLIIMGRRRSQGSTSGLSGIGRVSAGVLKDAPVSCLIVK